MSTFIINLNDTMAMSDSAVVELAKVISTCQSCVQEAETNCNSAVVGLGKVIGTCQPCVQETETNCCDVIIVVAICVTIFFVVGLVAWVLKIWIAGKKELLMEELQQKKSISAVELKKHEMEIEQLRQDKEVDREQKRKGNELKNMKIAQDIEFEKWEAEHKKKENELRMARYQQDTEQAKLDAELERKLREKESENEK